jgi:hypothetical protein
LTDIPDQGPRSRTDVHQAVSKSPAVTHGVRHGSVRWPRPRRRVAASGPATSRSRCRLACGGTPTGSRGVRLRLRHSRAADLAEESTVICLADPDQRIFDHSPGVDEHRLEDLRNALHQFGRHRADVSEAGPTQPVEHRFDYGVVTRQLPHPRSPWMVQRVNSAVREATVSADAKSLAPYAVPTAPPSPGWSELIQPLYRESADRDRQRQAVVEVAPRRRARHAQVVRYGV